MIEGEQNNRDGLWDIIIPSQPHDKTIVQTNNYTIIALHARLYAATHKYKRQHILYMIVQRTAFTQKSPTEYIQEFVSMNLFLDHNW